MENRDIFIRAICVFISIGIMTSLNRFMHLDGIFYALLIASGVFISEVFISCLSFFTKNNYQTILDTKLSLCLAVVGLLIIFLTKDQAYQALVVILSFVSVANLVSFLIKKRNQKKKNPIRLDIIH